MLRVFTISLLGLAGSVRGDDAFALRAKPLLAKYCYECHGEKKQNGGIEVFSLTSTDQAFRHHQFLKNIAQQVEDRDMPPDDADEQPTDDERAALAREIREVVARLESGEFPRHPGRPTVRRLNREEFSLTVKDLFAVEFQAGKDFPADGAGGEGFDNVGDALFIQPALMEKYLGASRRVIEAVYSNPEKKARVISVQPSDGISPVDAAKAVLTTQTSRAFRRRATDEEIGPLLMLFQKRLSEGAAYEDALRLPLQSLLVHPSFLFRTEQDEKGKSQWRISDFELATRLSYFLWATMPDEALFKLADQGKLSDPSVLRGEVQRMLLDPKAETISRFFAGQWLGFDEVREVSDPDPKRFPMFTQSLRKAMYRESVESFSYLVRENRAVSELIHADYTFANEELAKHYGIPDVIGPDVRRIELKDRNRGGIIGQASVLTATSMPLRTSPVKRGKWILDTLLGTPPPPPPPDAGVLPPDDKSTSGLSMRKRLEQHRAKPACAGCHAKIDPLGFGLENYDAIGRWRSEDANGKPLDSLATLPGGVAMSSPADLKDYLLSDNELFLRNLARKMLAYGLGRPLEYYDEPVIVSIVHRLRSNDLKIHALILGIVESHPFQYRAAVR